MNYGSETLVEAYPERQFTSFLMIFERRQKNAIELNTKKKCSGLWEKH